MAINGEQNFDSSQVRQTFELKQQAIIEKEDDINLKNLLYPNMNNELLKSPDSKKQNAINNIHLMSTPDHFGSSKIPRELEANFPNAFEFQDLQHSFHISKEDIEVS